MKEHKFEKYIHWGVTAVLVIASAVLMVFLLLELNTVMQFVSQVISILAPILIGAVLAFLVAPVYNLTRAWSGALIGGITKRKKPVVWLEKLVATVVSVLFVTAAVVSLFYLIIPQLYTSIVSIIDNMSVYVQNISSWIENMFKNNPELESEIMAIYQEVVTRVQTWAASNLLPNMGSLEGFENIGKVVGGVSSGVVGIINLTKNVFIGLIVMLYLLNIKETAAAYCKKCVYAFLPLRAANATIEEFRFIHRVFSGFIIGKLIDSLIIGVLCFILMKIVRLPFELLISVIIGVTNIIPFFGPLIGAIPSSILVLLISPKQCLYFLILILALQQFDGNVLGPKILGNSTGISSFWVLFSILLFGGLYGFVGMIIAVPFMAVILDLFTKLQHVYLRKKNLSSEASDYMDLKKIDEKNGTYIK